VAECVSQWKSFSSIDEVRSDILKICTPKGAILSYIERVEATHGTVLVSHTLMYITLSKYGLSENELLDILSYDKQVLMEIKNSQKSYFDCSEIQNKVPFALWSSLLHDLYPHLLRFSVVVGGCMTLQWKSCLLKNLALERYFNQTEKKAHFSGKLAYYFLGNVNATVSQTQSADYDDSQYGDKQCCSESTLNSQPLQLSTFCQLYNCRKLTELPHALFNAGRKETICKILSSFRWLKAYNEMGIVDELIDCISLMIPFVHVGKTLSGIEKEFYLLRNTLQLSFSALLINPNQLSAELIGRLMPQLEKSDSSKYFIQELLVESFSMQPPLLSPIHQYSKTSGECLLLEMYGHQDVVTCISAACVKVSDNQQKLMIVSSSADGSLLCWDCNGCGVLKTFTGHTDEVLSVSLTADGNFVLSGSKDNTAKFWKVSTSTCLYTLTSHTNVVSSVVVSSDGNKAISGSFDGTIKVWNTHHNSNFKGRLLFTVKLSSTQDKELQSSVSSLALANDDITLLVGCKSGHILIVNVISGQTLKSTILGNTSVDSVMINMYNNELCIVAVSNDFVHFGKFNSMTFKTPCKSKLEGIINVTLMNFDSWLESIKHLLTDNNINTVYFTDSSRLALAGTKSGSIQVWELVDTPQKIMSFSSLLGQSSCGNFIITSSKTSCTITIFNIENINIPLYEINDFQSSVTAMHMYSFPAMLITGHIDGSVKLWKQGEIAMEIVREFNNTDSGFCSRLNVYLGNEKLLMAGYSNGDVTLWDINEGKKLRHLHHHFSEIIFVSFYQQLYIISADITGRFVIKDIKTGAIMNNYFPHKGILTAVQVGRSQDNDIIIAGYVNGIIKAFTLPKITEIQTYTDHLSQISSLHFHTLSGVDYIISSSLDRSIRVWSFAADATDNSSSLLVVDFPIVSSVLNPLLSNIYYIDKNGYLGAVHFDVFGCNIILKSLLGNIDLETS
jgi:WD40 repeat protein